MKRACVILATLIVAMGTVGMNDDDYRHVTINPPPEFKVQPSDRTAVVDGVTSFDVEATGGVVSYQWKKSIDNEVTWTDITGATNQSLFFNPVQNSDAGKYKCRASNSLECPGTDSNVVTLTVLPAAPPKVEMKLSHAPGSHDVGMVFNAHTNLIQSVVKSPGSLPGGSTWADVTVVRLEFKNGLLGSRFIEAVTPGLPTPGLPADGDSDSFTFNGSNSTDGEDPTPLFDLLGWQGEVTLYFKVSGGFIPLIINVNMVDGTLNGSALSISGDYYTCPSLD